MIVVVVIDVLALVRENVLIVAGIGKLCTRLVAFIVVSVNTVYRNVLTHYCHTEIASY